MGHITMTWLALTWAGAAAAQAAADVAASFRLDNGAALVTACTVPPDHPLHDTARGFSVWVT